jgi:hypothetical protein
MNTIRTLAFAGLTVIASMGAASASTVQANQFQAMYQAQGQVGALSDIARYDHSGTRGRLDLGASPFHPEGPGNLSD